MKHTRLFLLPAMAALLHAAASAAPLQITTATGGNSLGASLSHDGSRIAFYSSADLTGRNADRNFEIHLYDRAGGTLRQVTDDARGFVAGSQLPTISADGSRIVFQSFETRGTTGFFRSLYHDVATQQTVALNDYSAQFQLTDIGRDGRLIALNRDNDGLRIVDTATGLTGPLLAFNPAALSMSGDGSRIATDGFRGGVRLIDAGSGSALQISPEGSGFNQTPDLSDDGRTLAFSSTFDPLGTNADGNQELFLYDVASGSFRQVTNTVRGFSLEASLSADGTRVAFISTADILGDNADGNQEVFVYDLLDNRFMQLTRTAGSNQFSTNAALSGDGLVVSYTSTGDFTGQNPGRVAQIFVEQPGPARERRARAVDAAAGRCRAGLAGAAPPYTAGRRWRRCSKPWPDDACWSRRPMNSWARPCAGCSPRRAPRCCAAPSR